LASLAFNPAALRSISFKKEGKSSGEGTSWPKTVTTVNHSEQASQNLVSIRMV
jgi:hypothetical protein